MVTCETPRIVTRPRSGLFSRRHVAAICCLIVPIFVVAPAYAVTNTPPEDTTGDIEWEGIVGALALNSLTGGGFSTIIAGYATGEAIVWLIENPDFIDEMENMWTAITEDKFKRWGNWGGPGHVNGVTGGKCSEATGFPRKGHPDFKEPIDDRDWAYYYHDIDAYDAAHTKDPEQRAELFRRADIRLADRLREIRTRTPPEYSEAILLSMKLEEMMFRYAPNGKLHDLDVYRDPADDTCESTGAPGSSTSGPGAQKPGGNSPGKPGSNKPSGTIKPIPYGDPSIGKPGVPDPSKQRR